MSFTVTLRNKDRRFQPLGANGREHWVLHERSHAAWVAPAGTWKALFPTDVRGEFANGLTELA